MFKRLFFALLLLATPLVADDCSLLRELYGVRALMLKSSPTSYDVDKYIDRRLDALRDPLPGGGYRWVRWVRPTGEGTFDKKLHRTKASVNAPDSFETTGEHAYAVRVAVPAKRTLFNANNPVYVGGVEIRYTADRKTHSMTEHIDALMQPDTSRTFDLPVIADTVEVRLASGSDSPGESLVEVHFKQAVPEDDRANPDYDAVRALQRVRGSNDGRAIDDEIADAEHRVFPDSEPLPLVAIVSDLRRADDLIHSKKDEEQDRGYRLLKETMRRLH